MADARSDAPRRTGWLVAAGVGSVVTVAIAVVALWALSVAVDTGTSTFRVLTGGAAGVIFWSWIVAGCWRRAHEPEPDLNDPVPVARSRAFVAANVVLVLLFTAFIGGGLWVGVQFAREAERVDLISHRVRVAARAADVTVDALRQVEIDHQTWMVTRTGPDPLVQLLPVDGATAVDVVVGDDEAAVLFRPDEGPPCVVLDLDADDLMSTRSTSNC